MNPLSPEARAALESLELDGPDAASERRVRESLEEAIGVALPVAAITTATLAATASATSASVSVSVSGTAAASSATTGAMFTTTAALTSLGVGAKVVLFVAALGVGVVSTLGVKATLSRPPSSPAPRAVERARAPAAPPVPLTAPGSNVVEPASSASLPEAVATPSADEPDTANDPASEPRKPEGASAVVTAQRPSRVKATTGAPPPEPPVAPASPPPSETPEISAPPMPPPKPPELEASTEDGFSLVVEANFPACDTATEMRAALGARRLLTDDRAEHALWLLGAYQRRCPSGRWSDEAWRVRLSSLCKLNRNSEAASLLEWVTTEYPHRRGAIVSELIHTCDPEVLGEP